MTRETAAIITVLLLITTNSIGLIYSLLVLKTKLFAKYRIQSKAYKTGIFSERMPLYLFNFFTLLLFAGLGTYFLYDFFEVSIFSIPVILFQVIFAFIIDDLYFYFMHRWMHENKFILRKIHSIHHRATTPFPLEYLYGHPLEWIMGMFGVVLGFGLILLVMPINIYAFWLFGALRNLHEIHIHSDLKLPFISKIPFISETRHHDDHHAKLTGNYSSTFTWMDRIFKSNFKD
jgi:sterol desaturase/sphingolipid hydroxylase (fatty acid hydroxylase superfamily)